MAEILAIEDDADLVFIYKTALAQSGHDVTTAQQISTARTILEDMTPALILLDMNMQDENSEALIYELRHQKRFNQTHIVIITADDTWKHRIRPEHITRFIVKPVAIADIIKLTNELTI